MDVDAIVSRAVAEAIESFGPMVIPMDRVTERFRRTIETNDDALARLRGADLVLASACAAGDARAIAALESRFQDDVKRAFKRIRNANVVYDDFLQVFRQKLFAPPAPKIAEYGGLGDLRAWLRVVATRTALDLVRAMRRVERPTGDDAILAVPTPSDDPDLAYLKNVYGKEVASAIEAAARELAPEERNVLREYYAQGLTIDQIGAVHGIHRATAARRVERARDQLVASSRRILGEKLGVSDSDLDSVMRLVQSELRVSGPAIPRVMKDCPDENTLARFVQGEATDEERATVEAHVDRCAACAELLAQLAYAYFDDGDDATAREAPNAKRAPPPAKKETEVGGVIATGTIVGGRYEIGPRIGRGGMGVVYAGRDPVLRRPVAVKVMNALAAPSDEERLLREARAMARVAHPDVVTVYNAGHVGGRVFLVMELVRGPSLRKWLEGHEPMTLNARLELFLAAGRGLVAAHAARVVHRDFKPENVLVDGRARVTDFGLAQPVPSADASNRDGPVSLGHQAWLGEHTRTGGGTLAYMSPEQLDGKVVGAKSDEFSFAVALYECAYGKHPFMRADEKMSAADLRRAISAGPAPPLKNTRAPAWLWPILERAMRVKADERWPSMKTIVEMLERGEGLSADWHIGAHVAGLSLMFFMHLFLVLIIPIGLLVPDSPNDAPEGPWVTALGWLVGILVATGWAPAGMVVTSISAYGMLRRRPWAYVTTALYAISAMFSIIGTPYAVFAAWSLTRPYVRRALGRKERASDPARGA